MPLTHLGRILRRNIWIILIATLLGAAIAFALGATQRPAYSATAKMLFSASESVSTPSELTAATTLLVGRIETYTSLVDTPLILDPVIQELGLNATAAQLAGSVSASSEGVGNVVSVTAASSDAVSAASLANAVAQSLAGEITAVQLAAGTAQDATAPELQGSMVDPATPPSRPASPDIPLMTLIGALLGFAVGVIVAGIRAYTDSRVRVRDDVARATSAAIPVEGVARAVSSTLVTVDAPTHPAAETYRRLYADMLARTDEPPRSLLVGSPTPQSSAAAVAANLAAVIAETGRTVTLVDADLRDGTLAEAFSVPSAVGLSDVLDARAELSSVRQSTTVRGLSLVPSGATTGAPSALIASDSMALVLDDLRAASDVVVVSAPALLMYADAAVLSGGADAALLVASSGDTLKRDLADAYTMLEVGGTPVSGVALTSVPKHGPDARWR